MKFFKTLLASILGVIIGLLFFVFVGIIIVSSSSEEPEPYVRNNSVLKISIAGNIPSRSQENPFDRMFNRAVGDHVSLASLKENLRKARSDDNIKGVWMEISSVSAAWSTLQEVHKLVAQFKKDSDKFVYASTDDIGYNEKGYYLATAADSVFSPPSSFFEFDGFYIQTTFYSGLLEKLGIQVEVTRHGKYKSAVEPYFRKSNSEANTYQLTQLLNKTSSVFLDAVSSKTGKSIDELNAMLNDKPHITAEYAMQNGLIDAYRYPEEVESAIKQRMGVDTTSELNTISNGRYLKVSSETAGATVPDTKNRIAVIYADGMILPQAPGNSPFDQERFITATNFRKNLDKVTEDNNVKALVVRVNSPGGSGSTSDVIWKMLRRTSKKIPVIASMGPVAASGGYYIAMAADTIVALPTTITGSIGVFGTKFNTKELFNDKLGITFDEVKSHKHADWLDPTRPLTSGESKAFQAYIDQFYQTFIGKVAEQRGLSVAQVDSIAQGRVWIGSDAQKEHLVDVLGGLDKALEIAAQRAGVEQYKVVSYPKPKTLYELFLNSAEAKAQTLFTPQWMETKYTQPLKNAFLYKKGDILSWMPYEITIQ